MRDLPGQLLRGHAMQNSEKDIWISGDGVMNP